MINAEITNMNTLVLIRPEIFSIGIMLFLIAYDRYCARFRDGKNVFFPFALVCLGHCIMALVTEVTVNMDGISSGLNDFCHILFFAFSLLYSLLYLDYVVSIVFPKGKQRRLILIGGVLICCACILVMLLAPIDYIQGGATKYSAGIGPTLCFALGFLFLIVADIIIVICHKRVDRIALGTVLPLSCITLGLLLIQILVPEFLFTAEALTITAVGLFFAVENPVGKFQKQAFVDSYLSVWNRNCYEYDLKHIIARKIAGGESLIYVIGDLNGLKMVNDTLSHSEGDRLLELTAGQLQKHMKGAYKIYRVGGDEFAAIYFDDDLQRVEKEIEAARRACGDIRMGGEIPIGISIGYAKLGKDEALMEAEKRADRMMYEEKRKFYDQRGFDRRKNNEREP